MFGKYEFNTEKDADGLIDALEVKNCSIVKLGFIVIEPETRYKNGKVKKEAILNLKYSVDVLWGGNEDKGWEQYRILLGKNKSSHEFAGAKYYESL